MTSIKTDDHGAIRLITIARPEKKNALTRAIYDALSAAVRAADADPAVKVIVLTGTGDSFSAGNDIQDFVASPPPVSRTVGPGGLFAALDDAKKPVIAAVNGMAVGIGTTALLHCDLVYAASSARFRLPFVSIGILPEGGSSMILPAMLGHRRAAEALLFGDWIDAGKAEAWGLVNAVFAPDALMAEVMARAERLAQLPARLLRMTKALMVTPGASLQGRMDEELGLIAEQIGKPEAQEAFAALAEKRKPDFSRFD